MHLDSDAIHFFVYGTLKRGECRESVWPRAPIHVATAWVHGELYDAGPYPALVHGHDKVLGELWTFPQVDLAAVVRVLDDVEEYRAGDPLNLYNRERIDCQTLSGENVIANTYLYARLQDLPTFQKLVPLPGEYVQWSAHKRTA